MCEAEHVWVGFQPNVSFVCCHGAVVLGRQCMSGRTRGTVSIIQPRSAAGGETDAIRNPMGANEKVCLCNRADTHLHPRSHTQAHAQSASIHTCILLTPCCAALDSDSSTTTDVLLNLLPSVPITPGVRVYGRTMASADLRFLLAPTPALARMEMSAAASAASAAYARVSDL